jgi:ribosomal protein S18 acetylase RimI-like enzyme
MIFMKVRKGGIGDCIKCIRINDVVWEKKWKHPGYFHKRVKEGELLVAEEAGKVLGYIAFRKHHFGDNWYIEELAVLPCSRRKGVASVLIEQVGKRCAREKVRLFSSTDSKNKTSLSLHRKNGFRRDGAVKNMFLDGGTEIVFSKRPR